MCSTQPSHLHNQLGHTAKVHLANTHQIMCHPNVIYEQHDIALDKMN